jgi:hypothetical protein
MPLVVTTAVPMPSSWQFTVGNPCQATEETLSVGSFPLIKVKVSLTKAIGKK